MRGDTHVRFGRRARETDPGQPGHRARARPNRSDTPGSCPTSNHRWSATQSRVLAPHTRFVHRRRDVPPPWDGRDDHRCRGGQAVLVTVGTFRSAARQGVRVRVTGVASTAKVDLVHALGAGRVINTSAGRLPTGRRYDDIVDASGPPTRGWSSSAPKTGGRRPGGLDRQLRALRPRFAGRPCAPSPRRRTASTSASSPRVSNRVVYPRPAERRVSLAPAVFTAGHLLTSAAAGVAI
jgi:hypothetical protein